MTEQVQVDLGIIFLSLGINFLIALGGWIAAYILYKDKQNQEKIDNQNLIIRKNVETIISLLDDYGELTSLYLYYGNYKTGIEIDKKGNDLKDEDGNYVTYKSVMEINPDVESAIKELEDRDLKGAINVKKLQIRRKFNQACDLSIEIDPSKELGEELTKFNLLSIDAIEKTIESKNFKNFNTTIYQADSTRRDIRQKLNNIWKKTLFSEPT